MTSTSEMLYGVATPSIKITGYPESETNATDRVLVSNFVLSIRVTRTRVPILFWLLNRCTRDDAVAFFLAPIFAPFRRSGNSGKFRLK